MNFLYFAFGIQSAVVIILLIGAVVLIVKVGKFSKTLLDQENYMKNMENNFVSNVDGVFRTIEEKERDFSRSLKDTEVRLDRSIQDHYVEAIKESSSHTDSRIDKFYQTSALTSRK